MDILQGTLAPLAVVCDECGSIVGREEHDAACFRGFVESMPPDYTDDSTDLPERYNGKGGK